MKRISHILDTSAILTHYFDEPGAEKVAALWEKGDAKPAVCAVTIPELRSRLAIEVGVSEEVEQAIHAYVDELASSVDPLCHNKASAGNRADDRQDIAIYRRSFARFPAEAL